MQRFAPLVLAAAMAGALTHPSRPWPQPMPWLQAAPERAAGGHGRCSSEPLRVRESSRSARTLEATGPSFAQEPAPPAPNAQPGYRDTPRLRDGWRVHDADRPQPPIVKAAPAGEPVPAPADATVLFDGKSLDAWRGRDGGAKWTIADGAMTVNGSGDIQTAAKFGDCQLHVEWASPLPVKGTSQARGNSGVFFFGRYEVQILDSFDNVTYADGQAAALYGQKPPLVNVCRAPGEWQTFDILFVAPRFAADGSLQSPARVTVLHNGVLVHHDEAMVGQTAHRALASYARHEATGPIRLQDHGDPVRFRNVWVRPLLLERPAPTATPAPEPAAK